MDQYKQLEKLGDGTYGTVFKGIHLKTNETVAIKQFKQKYSSWDECMQLKEIKALRKLNHPNIIKLREVLKVQDKLSLVFEFLHKNILEIYLEYKNSGRFMEEDKIRSIIRQVAEGLAYMHKHGFFHRYKIQGPKARESSSLRRYTKNMRFWPCERSSLATTIYGLRRNQVTQNMFSTNRWYRAPEILLKQPNYNSPVDIFALGCIMAELYKLEPLFNGNSQIDQLNKICKVLGTPNTQIWPEGIKLANQNGFTFPSCQPIPFESLIPNCSSNAIQLIQDMLKFDPSKRPSAQQILSYPYFQSEIPREIKQRNSIREEYKSESNPLILAPLKPPNRMQDTSQNFLEFLDQKLAENEKPHDKPLRQRDRLQTKIKNEKKPLNDDIDKEIQQLLDEEKLMKRSNPFRLIKQNEQATNNGFYQQQRQESFYLWIKISQNQNNLNYEKKNYEDIFDKELAGLLEEDKQMKKTNQFRMQKQSEHGLQLR